MFVMSQQRLFCHIKKRSHQGFCSRNMIKFTFKIEEWLRLSILLCAYGFIKEIRPSDPFLIDFLVGEWRNVTAEQVNRDVFPLGSYSNLVQLAFIFLITDFFRYKPLIFVNSLSAIIIWSILLWTTDLLSLQIYEIFIGTFLATEIAYYTYIYAKVDRQHFQKVTSYTRATIFFGRFLSAVTAQSLIFFKVMDFRQLNYITLTTACLATVWAIFLPSVKTSVYFHRDEPTNNESIETQDTKKKNRFENAFELLFSHFKQCYSNETVIRWSIFYALAYCSFNILCTYSQFLWKEIDSNINANWNGLVEAAGTFLGAVVAILSGYVSPVLFGQKKFTLIISIATIAQGGFLIFASAATARYVAYIFYLAYIMSYSFVVTTISTQIAKYLPGECFGLVFGLNTLIGILIQTIIVTLVISEHFGFGLSIRNQFAAFGIYHIAAGILFIIYVIIKKLFFKKTTKVDEEISHC